MKTQTKFKREKPLFRGRHKYKCIGYARQSANNPISIGAQFEELKKAGCVVVFQETVSSADKARPQFEAALGRLKREMKLYSQNWIEGSEIKVSALTPSMTFKKKGSMFVQPME